MISQERFDEIELEYGCGYWHECWEHACPCAITVENKGLRQDIWDDFKKEQEEIANEFDDDDFEYEPMGRCEECGFFVNESDLINGICYDCRDEYLDSCEEESVCDNYNNRDCRGCEGCEFN